MPMPMHYPSQSPHLEVALLSEKKQRRDKESREPGANHGNVGHPINPTKKPHPANTKQGSSSTAARPSNISNIHSHTSTRLACCCNTQQGRAQANHSQVFHRRKICTLATPLGFACLLRGSRDRDQIEKVVIGALLHLPPPATAVQVKHTEGTLVGHHGALQLWNGGALAHQGTEVFRPQGALDVQKALSRQ